MTETFGNRSTRSCWNRARAAGVVRPLERRDEGLRRLVEHARPEHEHEAAVARVAPVDVADARHPRADRRGRGCRSASCRRRRCAKRSCRLCSIDTSGSADGPFQNAPVHDALVRLEVIAIGDGVLARERSARAARPRSVSSVVSGRSTPSTRARSTGISCDVAGAVRRVAEERAHAVRPAPAGCRAGTCPARPPPTCTENSLEQARLQRPDADDEERAEADGEQDDARLVAGPRQVQHGVAQRKRPRVAPAARPARPAAGPASMQHERQRRRSPTQTTSADRSDAACHAVSADEREPTRPTIAAMPRPVARRGATVSSRSSSDGLTSRTCSSGTTENSSDTSTPIADALQRRAPA